MRSSHFLAHVLWLGLAISAPLTLDRPSLVARYVTPSAAISESVATNALEKRVTADEFAKSLIIDAGKVIPVSYILAWAQSLVQFPKPAGSTSPDQLQLPQSSPPNPAGGYYPGGPVPQDPRMQPVNPQSYNDPRTAQQAYYQDPRTVQQAYYQDPRSNEIQAQQLAYAGVQPPPQDSQPQQEFGRAQADFSRMGTQRH